MRQYRFYHPENLSAGHTYWLDATNSHQIINVLKLPLHQELWLFNNTAFDFKAVIQKINKPLVAVAIIEQCPNAKASPCKIHLAQALAKGEKMDYIIQKAVELGVTAITPIISARTIVKLAATKIPNRLAHWQKIIIHACSQCGNSILPTISPPVTLKEWIIQNSTGINIILNPESTLNITQVPTANNFGLLIGPEGGFSPEEIGWATKHGCIATALGPRILRTETAGIVAITGLQMQFGDLK